MVYLRQFPVPTEGIRYEQGCVEAIIDDQSSGKGTLYIAEEIISWINSSTGEGFTIPYTKITLHAISRDSNVHSSDCLYIMINGFLSYDEANGEEEVPQECEDDITEVRFVPDESQGLNLMYQSVQQCTLLHPDPSSDMSDDDNDADPDELFEGHEGGEVGHGLVEDDDDIGSDDEERIRQFERMQLHYGAGNSSRHSENGNENGDPPFDPDQFADAD